MMIIIYGSKSFSKDWIKKIFLLFLFFVIIFFIFFSYHASLVSERKKTTTFFLQQYFISQTNTHIAHSINVLYRPVFEFRLNSVTAIQPLFRRHSHILHTHAQAHPIQIKRLNEFHGFMRMVI